MKNLLILIPFILIGCSNEPSEPPSELRGGKFASIQDCLEGIKKASGYSTLNPMTDKPNHVSGYLGNSHFDFNCEVVETGTQGTYVDGWFEQETK
ncbi:hypothetical protein ACODTT_14650 [Acinetobacter pittii]|uniref:hypothetical protein n=1 Tax=Acinetobacter pittii TaxID=48296 RepID=UPI003B42A9D4